MKRIIYSTLFFCSLLSGGVNAEPIDVVKQSFEASHIVESDWMQLGDYQQASVSDSYRHLQVKLNPTDGIVKAEFTESEKDPLFMAEGYCWRLAALSPIEQSSDWSSISPDEKALSDVYSGDIKNGEMKKAVIKGWEFTRSRNKNTIYCSVKKGA
ncbi:hypothetical protein [Plesiomonas sp. ZOR0011]|uniref:hypothetical protein n=1 Tax=Plesiomonas sp. ZOR0011 TaxID=1339230 RepID=UPI0006487880|nr:hypothetical protein [Plesiomonas sp. ZOR0011]